MVSVNCSIAPNLKVEKELDENIVQLETKVTATTTIDDAFVEGQVAVLDSLPTNPDYLPVEQLFLNENNEEELVNPPNPVDDEWDEAQALRMWEVSKRIRRN